MDMDRFHSVVLLLSFRHVCDDEAMDSSILLHTMVPVLCGRGKYRLFANVLRADSAAFHRPQQRAASGGKPDGPFCVARVLHREPLG